MLNPQESGFTTMVSRGKLSHPSDELFDLSLYLDTYKSLDDKSCCARLLRGFQSIFEFTAYNIPNHLSVRRRYANCVVKAFAKIASQQLRVEIHSKKKKSFACQTDDLFYFCIRCECYSKHVPFYKLLCLVSISVFNISRVLSTGGGWGTWLGKLPTKNIINSA